MPRLGVGGTRPGHWVGPVRMPLLTRRARRMIGRSLSEDIDIGGWHVPSGSTVAISPLVMHRDPRWFPEPDTFDPQRWLDARRDDVPRHAYLPFGTGPRSCGGEQFAWAETITVLAVLASAFTARTQPGHVPRPQYRVTMRPGNGIPMRLAARTGRQFPA